ncbi:MAG: hypothetical protein HQL52_08360 [Magnetococcales bacterium]|nr:hypothetical protein [Magnetococcales bacterium]
MLKELFTAWKEDDLLSQAWNECYEALAICREMFAEAVHILREEEQEAVEKAIRKKDKQINRYQRDIRRKVITHCTLRGMDALPGGMVLVSIIIDIERIGDNVKNMLDLARAYPSRLQIPACEEILGQIEADIREHFQEIEQILKEYEVGKAREIMNRHRKQTRHSCDQMIDQLVRGEIEGITPSDSAALALYLRYLKRISAHLKNVATSVVNPFERIGFKEKRVLK